jgi:putative transport protein
MEPPGYAPGILAGANTISAVMGVASAAVSTGAFAVPAGFTAEQVQANIAAGYSLTYVFSILGIVILVRNLPAMFGIDPVTAGRESERKFGHDGHALPGTAGAFVVGMLPVDVRVLQMASNTLIGRPASEVFKRFDTPVLKLTRAGVVLDLGGDPALLGGDLLTVGGPIASLIALSAVIGPEIDDVTARHLDVDQADVMVTAREWVGRTRAERRHNLPGFGVRLRAWFRGGQELPLLPGAAIQVHDVVRVIGPASGVSRFIAALGPAVQPTEFTRIAPLALGMAIGYAIGLYTVRIAGVPVGLGTMGGVVVMGILVSWARAIFPAVGGPVPEGARQFLESIGVDLFVTGLGLTVAPSIVESLSQGAVTFSAIGLGLVTAVVPTFLSWLVGLYVLRMDPIVLAGAVAGARNSTTAMKAISDQAHSAMPAFGYPVPYALSTIVFLIYGYLAMMLS